MRLTLELLLVCESLITLVKCSTGGSADESLTSESSSNDTYYTAQSSVETDDDSGDSGSSGYQSPADSLDDIDGNTCPQGYTNVIFTKENVKKATNKQGMTLCTFSLVDTGSLNSLSFEIWPDKSVTLFSSYCPVKGGLDERPFECVEGPLFHRVNNKCYLWQIDNLDRSAGMKSFTVLDRRLLPSDSYHDLPSILEDSTDSSERSSSDPSPTEEDQTDGMLSKQFKSLGRRPRKRERRTPVKPKQPVTSVSYKADDTSSKQCESIFMYVEYVLRCTRPSYGKALIGKNAATIRRQFLEEFCSSVVFKI
ncbi:hypothetical protein FOL47_006252 [Perkinsus chesapeaki]|uniref:Uncharacterized protein n=1 Tax=Perkinsus chesapeaki TaxID=330153 RepID=A0A7J6LSX4_PERCH|nr:hypothetical protein FOL47_006252 [Perkinsus chesapeaki]